MAVETKPVEASLDNRSPYSVAVGVVTTITRLSDHLKTVDDVLEAIVEAWGPGSRLYVRTIARTRHSVFYHHLQFLYEFGREHVRADAREDFCAACGRVFMDSAGSSDSPTELRHLHPSGRGQPAPLD